jgi:7-keto-8-aminopelargonate synthetase-like enzyme
LLRQRSRPIFVSNSLAPSIVGASIKVLNLLKKDTTLRDQLEWNTNYFKAGMKKQVLILWMVILQSFLYEAAHEKYTKTPF